MNVSAIETIHLASQYLAAAGISFVEKRDDDSHTNIGFDTDHNRFYTWELNRSGDFLALQLEKFSLEWVSASGVSAIELDGHSHREVIDWISETSEKAGMFTPYTYEFHYSLPHGISKDFIFLKDRGALQKEIFIRTLINKVLADVQSNNGMVSDIRTWPHHFDTGAFAGLPGREAISIGMGLSIPDSVVTDYYFYIGGYQGHDPIDTSSFEPMEYGQWLQQGFEGAVLDSEGIDEPIAIQFFQDAICAFQR